MALDYKCSIERHYVRVAQFSSNAPQHRGAAMAAVIINSAACRICLEV